MFSCSIPPFPLGVTCIYHHVIHRYTHDQNIYTHLSLIWSLRVVQDNVAVCTRAPRLNTLGMIYIFKFLGLKGGFVRTIQTPSGYTPEFHFSKCASLCKQVWVVTYVVDIVTVARYSTHVKYDFAILVAFIIVNRTVLLIMQHNSTVW